MNRWLLWTVGAGLFFLFSSPAHAISFTLSNPQVSDQITIDITISGATNTNCPNSRCYLQGMLTAVDQNKYFGFTQNNSGDWYEYISEPEPEYIQSSFFSLQLTDGNWSGQLKIKNNPQDPDYQGPGNYLLKVKRYTGNSSSGSFAANDLNVTLTQASPSPSPTPTPTPSPTSTPTSAPNPTPTPTLRPTSSPQVLAAKTASSASTASPSADMADINLAPGLLSTPSASPELATPSGQGNLPLAPFLIAGGGLIALSSLLPLVKKWYHQISWLKPSSSSGAQSSSGPD